MKRRTSGILLHITSLPSLYGIGDLGPCAARFADFLEESGQSRWQILPVNPVHPYSNSPYQAISAFAGNPLLISPEKLVSEGLLDEKEAEKAAALPGSRVDYASVRSSRENMLSAVCGRFKVKGNLRAYDEFCKSQNYWLDDYALFQVIKSRFKGKIWNDWPEEFRDRSAKALKSINEDKPHEIENIKIMQYLFFSQWSDLKDYCFRKGVQLIGDMPIYMHLDSADVWAHREIFKLDEKGRPFAVAGVPPDYFSETGQLWGNPVYRWDVLEQRKYDWWIKKISHKLDLTDKVRIDHFRGLVAYWEVPGGETTAINGRWITVPVTDFMNQLLKRFPHLPVIAEDLGTITPDVTEIMNLFDLPGMKVLLFAFGDDLATNPYVPHNVTRNSVIYTGTHDNNTVRGWFENEAGPETKERLFSYLGRNITAEEVTAELIRLAMMSVADTAIIPMQDILDLGEEARMNRPAGEEGNWEWRLLPGQLTPDRAKWLRDMTITYGRA